MQSIAEKDPVGLGQIPTAFSKAVRVQCVDRCHTMARPGQRPPDREVIARGGLQRDQARQVAELCNQFVMTRWGVIELIGTIGKNRSSLALLTSIPAK